MAAVDAKYALIEPDPFLGKNQKASSFIPNYYAGELGEVHSSTTEQVADINMWTASRPLSGIQAKPNSHAIVQVIDNKGVHLKMFNRLGDEGDAYQPSGYKKAKASTEPDATVWTDWLLTSVHEERAEKTQIVETFGDTYLYAFGQRPRVLAFGGLLFNTTDYNWRAIFWENWDKYFRATKLVEKNARMYIYFDDILVEGYPLNAAADQSSNDNNAITFHFQFFVTNYINLVAQRGFDVVRSSVTDVVKAGWAHDDYSVNLDPKYNRLIDMIPGFAAVKKFALGEQQVDGSFIGGSPLARNAAGVLPSASDATAATIAIAAGLREPPNVGAIIANTAAEQMAYWKQVGITELEKKGNIQPGDVNTWFGFLANILERAAATSSNTTNNPLSAANAFVNKSNKNGIADAINAALRGNGPGVGVGLTKATGIATLTIPGGV